MSYPITPQPNIHHRQAVSKFNAKQLDAQLAEAKKIEAMAEQMVGAIINSVLNILTGGALGGTGTTNGIDLFGNLFANLFKTLGITDPGGTLATIEQDIYNVEQTLEHWVDNVMAPLNLVLDGKTWQGFINDVVGGFNNSVHDLTNTLKTTISQAETAIGQLVQMIESSVTGTLSGLVTQIQTMLTNTSQLPGGGIIGTVPTDVLHVLDLGSIDQTLQELTGNGAFLSSAAIDEAAMNAGILWDGTTSVHTETPGSARFECWGNTKSLFSNPITVTEGQKIDFSTYVRWQSLSIKTGTSTPAELNVAKFKDGALVGYDNIARAGGVGSGGWTKLSGTYTVPAGVDRLRMKLTVRSDAVGGYVWFDEASMTRSGILEGSWMSGIKGTVSNDFQSIVDQIYHAITGSASSGQDLTTIVSNFQYAWNRLFGVSYVNSVLSGLAIPALPPSKIFADGSKFPGGAGGVIPDITAAMSSDLQATLNNIYKAVTGSNVTSASAADALGQLQSLMYVLFYRYYMGSATAISANAVPVIDGTKIDGSPGAGKVPVTAVPVTDVGKAINPTSGSGAMLSRVASDPMVVSGGRHLAPDGFFTTLTTASSDIHCLTTSGATATGTRSDYAGAFQVTTAGWYLVEICYRMNVGFGTGGMNLAPVLYKGGSLGGTGVFKVGTDIQFLWLATTAVTQRFVQNSFIVYLNANEVVRAGMDVGYGGFSTPSVGGESGVGSSAAETYFSISMLNKSFA